MEYFTRPTRLRLLSGALVALSLAGVIAIAGFTAFSIGFARQMDQHIADPGAAPSNELAVLTRLSESARDRISFALMRDDPEAIEAAIEEAQIAASSYTALTDRRTAGEIVASVNALASLLAQKERQPIQFQSQFFAAQTALSAAIAAEERRLMRTQYARVRSLNRWHTRAGIGALSALVLIAGGGAIFIGFMLGKYGRIHSATAKRFHEAVSALESSQKTARFASEGLRREARQVRVANVNLESTTEKLVQIGKAFGHGAEGVLTRLEHGSDRLAETAIVAATRAADAADAFGQARADLTDEVDRTRTLNTELGDILERSRSSFALSGEALSQSANAFERASNSAMAQFDAAVLNLRGGEEAFADVIASTKLEFAKVQGEIENAVSTLHGSAKVFDRAARLYSSDSEAQKQAIGDAAHKIIGARNALLNSVSRLSGEKGVLTLTERRLRDFDDKLAGAYEGKSTMQAASGLAAVLGRLNAAAQELEQSAVRFAEDENGQNLPDLEEFTNLVKAASDQLKDAGLLQDGEPAPIAAAS